MKGWRWIVVKCSNQFGCWLRFLWRVILSFHTYIYPTTLLSEWASNTYMTSVYPAHNIILCLYPILAIKWALNSWAKPNNIRWRRRRSKKANYYNVSKFLINTATYCAFMFQLQIKKKMTENYSIVYLVRHILNDR